MRAMIYDTFGDPEVLHPADVDEPHAGAGRVRIRVMAASVNRWDTKQRAGFAGTGAKFPVIPGLDASGIVDEVGDGVEGFVVGDEVFGKGVRTAAEFAVLRYVAKKPTDLDWAEAAAIPVVTETAERGLRLLAVREGDRVLVEGASGGVGAVAAQLAVARGASVVGTASLRNHDYLRSLSVMPTTYGPGLPGRLRELGVTRFHAVFDASGAGSLSELVTLVDDPAQVVTLADSGAEKFGARGAGGGSDAAWNVLERIAELRAEADFRVRVDATFSLEDAATAHALVESGRASGKVVLLVG